MRTVSRIERPIHSWQRLNQLTRQSPVQRLLEMSQSQDDSDGYVVCSVCKGREIGMGQLVILGLLRLTDKHDEFMVAEAGF